MNATQLIVEYVVIGVLALFGFSEVIRIPPDEVTGLLRLLDPLSITIVSISFAYVIGFLINALAEVLVRPFYRIIEYSWMQKEGNASLVIDHIRYDLYTSQAKDVIQRVDYHRSLLRVARSIVLLCIILLGISIFQRQFSTALLLVGVILAGGFAYYRRVIWFTRTVYYSWLSFKRRERQNVTGIGASSDTIVSEPIENSRKSTLTIFAGGTGFREINIELAKYPISLCRVVPTWDNGGSSKILRKYFPVIPIGDVRHALMTMAHGEGRLSNVVRLFNWRLPSIDANEELRNELARFTSGDHPLISSVDPSLKDVIRSYLQQFYNALPKEMDLRNGSIGNFVITGAFLTHSNDINTAIYVFRQLCHIRGKVWPISTEPNVHIGANLDDGTIVLGQEKVTNLDRDKYRQKIQNVFFTKQTYGSVNEIEKIEVQTNHLVHETIENTNLIVFGPGSFFTSILPHLMVGGVSDMIAGLDVPKVFISNILECNETYNYSLSDLIDIFLNTAQKHGSVRRTFGKYLTHILVNNNHELDFVPGTNWRYLPFGRNLSRFTKYGITFIKGDFEDPWQRGHHNPRMVSDVLLALAEGKIILPLETQQSLQTNFSP